MVRKGSPVRVRWRALRESSELAGNPSTSTVTPFAVDVSPAYIWRTFGPRSAFDAFTEQHASSSRVHQSMVVTVTAADCDAFRLSGLARGGNVTVLMRRLR